MPRTTQARAQRNITDINFIDEYARFLQDKSYGAAASARKGFRRHLKQIVIESHVRYVDTYMGFCVDCWQPNRSNQMYSDYTRRGKVCYSCTRNYNHCSPCNTYYRTDSDSAVNRHTHDRNCCRSSATNFTLNSGGDTIAQDTRFTVTLPSGEISDVGISTIRSRITGWAYDWYHDNYDSSYRDEALNDRVSAQYNDMCEMARNVQTEVGTAWQAKNGNFTKRLSRYAYNKYKLKLPPELLTQIGNIASEHSVGKSYSLEITRQLNLPARDFVHEGSCWWSSYSASRCILKTNGGFGLRSYSGSGRVEGRAWVMPLKVNPNLEPGHRNYFVPTYDTSEPAAYVVFNGYGELNGYAPSRVLSQIVGMTYRKISWSAGSMYVNGDSAYLIAPEELASRYTDGGISIDPEVHSTLYRQEAPARKAAATRATINAITQSVGVLTTSFADLATSTTTATRVMENTNA